MRDVAIGHDVGVIIDDGLADPDSRASMNGHVLAQRYAVTDRYRRRLTLVFQVLGSGTDAGEWEDADLVAERNIIADNDMILDVAVPADFHLGINDGEGADARALADYGIGMNNRRRMHFKVCRHRVSPRVPSIAAK